MTGRAWGRLPRVECVQIFPSPARVLLPERLARAGDAGGNSLTRVASGGRAGPVADIGSSLHLHGMCGRFDTSHLTWADIHRQLSTLVPVMSAAPNMEPNADVRPTTAQLVARLDGDGWIVESRRWGLVPFWHSGKRLAPSARGAGDGFKLTTFNCKVENFAPDAKPSATFKGPYAKARCIVPASAWYEWRGPEGAKTKYRFSRADGQPIWFAGLYERCNTSDAGEVQSFTIMTGPSEGALAAYHDRAPVILEPDEWTHWLEPGRDAHDLMRAIRPERFEVAAAG